MTLETLFDTSTSTPVSWARYTATGSESKGPPQFTKMEIVKQEGKTGITHSGEHVPAWVTLVNEKLEMAIKKAAYKHMMPEEEVGKIIYS